jgi:hypothetical protein
MADSFISMQEIALIVTFIIIHICICNYIETSECSECNSSANIYSANNHSILHDTNPQDKSLLPVFSPLFNMRETCKHICLLEDHLVHPRKRCNDCITKHFLTIEGFLEEGIALDKNCMHHKTLKEALERVKTCVKMYNKKEKRDHCAIAQILRQTRKKMQPMCFKYPDSSTK